MNDLKIRGFLMGFIIGDALGMPFEGLPKAHIHATFKNINDFTDAGPALKGKLQNWKKPGLYGSLSQMIILLSIFLLKKKYFDNTGFTGFIKELPESAESEYGIFRHPGAMLAHFIKKIKSGKNHESIAYSRPGADAALTAFPITLYESNYDALIKKSISFSMSLTTDIDSITGAVILTTLIYSILNKDDNTQIDNIITYTLDTIPLLKETISKNTASIFEYRVNPDYILSSIEDYSNILDNIKNISKPDESEKIIYSYINKKIKSPITRATVNHPKAIIPFSMSLIFSHKNNPSNILFDAATKGGSSPLFCALTGAITGLINDYEWIPRNLTHNLINKKRIATIVEGISGLTISDELIRDFIAGEASLSAKETQEKQAKLKHVKVKVKKQKSRRDIENELSSHIVESWTKLDRAKWRKKIEKDKERN